MGELFSKTIDIHNDEWKGQMIDIFIYFIYSRYNYNWMVAYAFDTVDETTCFKMTELKDIWHDAAACIQDASREACDILIPSELVFDFMNILCENSRQIQLDVGMNAERYAIQYLLTTCKRCPVVPSDKFRIHLKGIWNELKKNNEEYGLNTDVVENIFYYNDKHKNWP